MTVADELAVPRSGDDVRQSLRSNAPLAAVLHVVTVVSNPCQYRRRYELARRFMERTEHEPHVALYVVELAYGETPHQITDAQNPRHLQLRSQGQALWHKENLVNCGVRALLPPDWAAVAWIDADVAFESPTWAEDALRLLNGRFDVVQLFSLAEDLGPADVPLNVFGAFGREHVRGAAFAGPGRYWHPGFAWACTRQAYERCGGLLEVGIVGSGDYYMAAALLGQAAQALRADFTADYRQAVLDWQRRAAGLRLGYVPGVLRHSYHGDKAKRQYKTRPAMLAQHAFAPSAHLARRADGLLEPSAACPPQLLQDLAGYFRARDEDSIYRLRVPLAAP